MPVEEYGDYRVVIQISFREDTQNIRLVRGCPSGTKIETNVQLTSCTHLMTQNHAGVESHTRTEGYPEKSTGARIT